MSGHNRNCAVSETEGMKAMFFLPIIGYFLYIPTAMKRFPDLTARTLIGNMVENTVLYAVVGGLIWFVNPTLLWPIVLIVVPITCAVEFTIIGKGGDRLRRILGWHQIEASRDLQATALYSLVHCTSFLLLGFGLASLYVK